MTSTLAVTAPGPRDVTGTEEIDRHATADAIGIVRDAYLACNEKAKADPPAWGSKEYVAWLRLRHVYNRLRCELQWGVACRCDHWDE